MKIGLVGFPGSGKSSVFGALTGLDVETGYAASRGKANLGVVKVPDPRVDALATLFEPKKTTYAEVHFSDLAGGSSEGLERSQLVAMREVDALCQVLRAFPNAAEDPPDPLRELLDLETETILADLEVTEKRIERLAKDRSDARELELLQRVRQGLEEAQPVRALGLREEEEATLSGFAFLSGKPLLLVLNVAEEAIGEPVSEALESAARERGLGLVALSASVEMDVASMPEGEQGEFLEALGLAEPARNRFVRASFDLIGLISMLTSGPDECRAWAIARDTPAPRAAGKIHSDIERGFIRAEVVPWQDLIDHGSEARCREQGLLRVEGRDYIVQDGDVINFRFNV